jgi:hypothetical protein
MLESETFDSMICVTRLPLAWQMAELMHLHWQKSSVGPTFEWLYATLHARY